MSLLRNEAKATLHSSSLGHTEHVCIAATPQQECKLVFASRQRRDRLAPCIFFDVFYEAWPVMSLLRNEAKTTLHSSSLGYTEHVCIATTPQQECKL